MGGVGLLLKGHGVGGKTTRIKRTVRSDGARTSLTSFSIWHKSVSQDSHCPTPYHHHHHGRNLFLHAPNSGKLTTSNSSEREKFSLAAKCTLFCIIVSFVPGVP